MTDLHFIYDKAKTSPRSLSFFELCALAEKTGFRFSRQKGTSHRIYKHPKIHDQIDMFGMINIQDVKSKAKPYQIRQVLKLIDKYKLIEGR